MLAAVRALGEAGVPQTDAQIVHVSLRWFPATGLNVKVFLRSLPILFSLV